MNNKSDRDSSINKKQQYTNTHDHNTHRECYLGSNANKLPSTGDVMDSIRYLGDKLRDIHRRTFEKERYLGLERKLNTAGEIVQWVLKGDTLIPDGRFAKYYTSLSNIKDIINTYKDGVFNLVRIKEDDFNLSKCLATSDHWWDLERYLRKNLIGEQIKDFLGKLVREYNRLYSAISEFFEREWEFNPITGSNPWEEYMLLSGIEEAELKKAENKGKRSSSDEVRISEYMEKVVSLSDEKSNPFYLVNELLGFVKEVKKDIKEAVEGFRETLYAHNGLEGNYEPIEDFNVRELLSLDSIEYPSDIVEKKFGVAKRVEEEKHDLLERIIKNKNHSKYYVNNLIDFRIKNAPWRVYPILEIMHTFGRKFLTAYTGEPIKTEWEDLIGIDEVKSELESFIVTFMANETKRDRTILMYGAPGTGKTSAIGAAAKKFNFKLINVDSSKDIWAAAEITKQLDNHFLILLDDYNVSGNDYHTMMEFTNLLLSAGGIKQLPENIAIVVTLNLSEEGLERKLARRFGLKLSFKEPDEKTIREIYKHYFQKYDYLLFKDKKNYKGYINDNTIDLAKLASYSKKLSPAEVEMMVQQIVEKKCDNQDQMIDIIKNEWGDIQEITGPSMHG